MGPADDSERSKLTLWQRLAVRQLRRQAGRRNGEPLRPEDWEVAWRIHETGFGGATAWFFRALPHSPRCGVCAAPFAGPGRWIAILLSGRVADGLPVPPGMRVELQLKGMAETQTAYRVSI